MVGKKKMPPRKKNREKGEKKKENLNNKRIGFPVTSMQKVKNGSYRFHPQGYFL